MGRRVSRREEVIYHTPKHQVCKGRYRFHNWAQSKTAQPLPLGGSRGGAYVTVGLGGVFWRCVEVVQHIGNLL